MPQTSEYKLGYANGYNARNRDQWKVEQRHQAEVLAVAQRAERAEKAAGVGHCEDCQHWRRPHPTYAWGICTATKAPGTPWGCWAQAEEVDTRRTVQISTSPRFGCVLFQTRAAALAGDGSRQNQVSSMDADRGGEPSAAEGKAAP